MKTKNQIQKPIPLRVIFILNALMMILPFVFYYVITSTGKDLGIPPMYMIYTGVAYIVSFILLVFCILKKNITGLRIILILNFLIAMPAKAYLGFIIAFISIVLSFHKKVKAYFTS